MILNVQRQILLRPIVQHRTPLDAPVLSFPFSNRGHCPYYAAQQRFDLRIAGGCRAHCVEGRLRRPQSHSVLSAQDISYESVSCSLGIKQLQNCQEGLCSLPKIILGTYPLVPIYPDFSPGIRQLGAALHTVDAVHIVLQPLFEMFFPGLQGHVREIRDIFL